MCVRGFTEESEQHLREPATAQTSVVSPDGAALHPVLAKLIYPYNTHIVDISIRRSEQ